MAKPKVLGIVLAGGEGKRLMPLDPRPGQTGGAVRRQLSPDRLRAVQPRQRRLSCGCACSRSTSRTRSTGTSRVTWRMSTLLGNYVTPVPAQQRLGKQWYLGSADAIYQSMNLIVDEKPDIIVVFGADHVYRMDASQMVAGAHRVRCGGVGRRHPGAAQGRRPVRRDQDRRRRRPDQRVPREAGRSAGSGRQPRRVVRVDGQLRVHRRRAGRGAREGRRRRDSRHDMGGDIIPMLRRTQRGRGLRLQAQRRARARRATTATTGAMSGRWRRTTRRTSIWSPSSRPSTSTTTTGRSTPHYPQLPGAKFVEEASADDAIVCVGLDRLGCDDPAVGARAQRLRLRPAPSSSAA